MEWVLPLIGFALAAYATVANDSIQTLGTFLASNRQRPWWVLWMFAGSILSVVLIWGWYSRGGDAAFGRLDAIEMPAHFSWVYLIPPAVLLLITRVGIPVSTTFLILTTFSPKSLDQMLAKSLGGYVLAFAVGAVVYWAVTHTLERRFQATADRPPARAWVALQWASTAFLWSQWLMQDLANVFVYMPRRMDLSTLLGGIALMLVLQGWIFYKAGGEIQKIVTDKTATYDIRSATIIDFLYGCILFFFKEWSAVPMSTTWAFLGLLAGRELALTLRLRMRPFNGTVGIVMRDMGKAGAGLAISIMLAFGLPVMARMVDAVGTQPATAAAHPELATEPGEGAPQDDDAAADASPLRFREERGVDAVFASLRR